MDDYDVSGKHVLVWGLDGCNCEAIALWKNAAEVYVVDYNTPTCEHKSVHTITHDELRKSGMEFDVAISFSLFEHDGLGRYGDPINPDGDLHAMQDAGTYVKEDGIFFLGVPLGSDCLVWNAHRIYGPVRLPLLLRDWLPLDVYSICSSVFDAPPGGVWHRQPLLVLKKDISCRHNVNELVARLKSIRPSADTAKRQGTKNNMILCQILEFMLLAWRTNSQ
jgi:hypothetical protein